MGLQNQKMFSIYLRNINILHFYSYLIGHEGKVWSVDIDRRRIVSGGRFGEIRVWSLSKCLEEDDNQVGKEILDDDVNEDIKGRSLYLHQRDTAVGQVRIEKALMISCDGIGRIILSNFWKLEKNSL